MMPVDHYKLIESIERATPLELAGIIQLASARLADAQPPLPKSGILRHEARSADRHSSLTIYAAGATGLRAFAGCAGQPIYKFGTTTRLAVGARLSDLSKIGYGGFDPVLGKLRQGSTTSQWLPSSGPRASSRQDAPAWSMGASSSICLPVSALRSLRMRSERPWSLTRFGPGHPRVKERLGYSAKTCTRPIYRAGHGSRAVSRKLWSCTVSNFTRRLRCFVKPPRRYANREGQKHKRPLLMRWRSCFLQSRAAASGRESTLRSSVRDRHGSARSYPSANASSALDDRNIGGGTGSTNQASRDSQ